MSQLSRFVTKNLRYPSIARKAKLEGRVFFRFVINEQGAIKNVRVLKGVSPELDAEATRLIRRMPNWLPARIDNRIVASLYNIPINFSLN